MAQRKSKVESFNEKVAEKMREEKGPISLTEREIGELKGFQAREREIEREILQPFRQEIVQFFERVGVEHKVRVGEDYTLNPEAFCLVPVVKKEE